MKDNFVTSQECVNDARRVFNELGQAAILLPKPEDFIECKNQKCRCKEREKND